MMNVETVTIRQWLNAAGFNWHSGKIIYHKTDDDAPGWSTAPIAIEGEISICSAAEYRPENNDNESSWLLPILDKEFDSSYGSPQCPRFVADDDERIYFPAQYDGSTWLEFVYKDINKYLDAKHPTPYPGG